MSQWTTPECIISYPRLFEPEPPFPGQDPAYTATFVFVPGTNLEDLQQMVMAIAIEKFGPDAVQMFQTGELRNPFLTDATKAGYPEGSVYIRAKANKNRRPGVISAQKDPTTQKWRKIIDSEEVYPGCIVRAAISVFAYDNVGKGVSFGLEGVQKIRDGDRLDNRISAEDAFQDTPEQTADLSDVAAQATAEADTPVGTGLPAQTPAANDIGAVFGT